MAFPDYRYRPAKGQWKLERGEADQHSGSKMSSGSRNAGLYSPEPPPPPQMMASRLEFIYSWIRVQAIRRLFWRLTQLAWWSLAPTKEPKEPFKNTWHFFGLLGICSLWKAPSRVTWHFYFTKIQDYKPVMSNTIATSHMWLFVIYFVAIRKLRN